MTFDVAADNYVRFMGQFSVPLAAKFVDVLDLHEGQRALDVGCGPGMLTSELVERLGAEAVSAVDPSASFVAAAAGLLPGVDVRTAAAEALPFGDQSFDRTLAQLVVHFMADPVGGLREMARVARPGGTVAACVWDHAGGGGPLALFWQAVADLDPGAHGEGDLPGASEGSLALLFDEAGLTGIEDTSLMVPVRHETFEEWWEPYTLGVGPAGDYVRSLTPDRRDALRERCRELAPAAPFHVLASAWAVRARA